LHQGFGLGVDFCLVFALHHFFGILQRGFDLGFFVSVDLVAVFGQGLLDRVDQAVELVTRSHQFVQLLVFFGIQFRIAHHVLDFGFRETRGCLNGDACFLSGSLVLGADVQNTVGVDVKGHFDLRHTARGWRNIAEVELAQALVG